MKTIFEGARMQGQGELRTLVAHKPLLPEIVALHARWRGDQSALICGDQARSWAELDATANRVANALLAGGFGRGDCVALVMGNSAETVEASLGIMKSGCVSAPINLTINDAAIETMLEDASAKVVIATSDQCARLAPILAKRPDLLAVAVGEAPPGWQAYDQWVAAAPATPPAVQIAPDDWFNIIYSSGTTGLPKGIVHTHQGRLDWAYDLALALRYHEKAVVLCTFGLYSNFSWGLMCMAFLCGAKLVILPAFAPKGFLEVVEEHKITHTAMVPIQYQMILDHPDCAAADLSSMQSLLSAGASLHSDLKARLFERFDCGVFELYGMTEGIITTISPEDTRTRLASVGRPVQGSDIRIIDAQGHVLGPDQPGEIVGYGPHLMPGYLNRPDANAEVVWEDETGRKWLRTGDIGTVDGEGFLYIIDRIKDMILSGGQNIYPGDIEAVLLTHPDVSQGTVIGVAHPKWNETPLAVVIAREGAAADAEGLTAWVNERVGKRQRICGVVFTDTIPRNPNGKVLKLILREKHGDFLAGQEGTS